MDDEGIRAAFHEAVATLDPPVERLVAGAMARGRRRTLVMRAGAALSVTAVLGGAAALVVALLPGPAAHRSSAIGPGGPSSGRVPATRSVSAIEPGAQPDTVTMTPQALLQTALDTLPRDGTTSRYAGNFDDNGFVSVQFVFDDGNGAAQVDVAMQYPPKHVTPHAPEPIIGCRPAAEGCTVLAGRCAREHPGEPRVPVRARPELDRAERRPGPDGRGQGEHPRVERAEEQGRRDLPRRPAVHASRAGRLGRQPAVAGRRSRSNAPMRPRACSLRTISACRPASTDRRPAPA